MALVEKSIRPVAKKYGKTARIKTPHIRTIRIARCIFLHGRVVEQPSIEAKRGGVDATMQADKIYARKSKSI
jgi:hypothetical protein